VLLEEGDRVPADGRLITSIELRIDESAFTGESVAGLKDTTPVPEDATLADSLSMAYSGTVAMRGRGRLLVTSTGMQSEVGRIAREVQRPGEETTVFQRDAKRPTSRVGWAVAVLMGIVAALHCSPEISACWKLHHGGCPLAVAAVPKGLPVVLTLALAFGTRRILDHQALVRSLPVVEIVGAAEVIFTDKTGTVTEGRLTVRQVSTLSEEVDAQDLMLGQQVEPLRNALLTAALCNNAHHHPEYG
jgi:Ca2+-transporting ATPase